jgi:endo-1,4-beta-xylanase
MKKTNPFHYLIIIRIILLAVPVLFITLTCKGQDSGTNEAIAKYRKGELIVQAKRGSRVTVEQIRHEFWNKLANCQWNIKRG